MFFYFSLYIICRSLYFISNQPDFLFSCKMQALFRFSYHSCSCIEDNCSRLPQPGQTKRSPLQPYSGLRERILFCVIDGAALADDVDLDLAGVIQRVLDLLCDLAGQQDDLIVADDIGLDHDAHFAACLNGKGLLDALEAGEISSRFSRRLT